MNKLVIIPLAILLLAGMLFAQNSTSDKPLVNPNVKPQHNCMDNPNLKDRRSRTRFGRSGPCCQMHPAI